MRHYQYVLLFTTLLMVSGCTSNHYLYPKPAAETAATPTWNGPAFKRMTIMVSDLDRTTRLWRDIMGFQVAISAPSGPTSYSYPVFNIAKNATIRYATVSAGPAQQRTFAFAEIKGQPVVVPQSPRVAAAVINANGRLADIIKLVKAEGLEVIPATVLNSATRGIGIEQAFVDWDGHLIVLYEFPPAIRAIKITK
jgi:catechol 2,3-dioxygenase-like lactoylglutathione lyase family enzyme